MAPVDRKLPDGGRAALLAHAGPLSPASSPADPATQSDSPAAPVPAHDPDDPHSTTGEIGRSNARITVGEGDDRVALWIGVRGESVRVEAHAHSAAYAEALNRRADELAAGLADRGLVLGSLSADVQGDAAPRPDPRGQDHHTERHEPSDPDGTDLHPSHPRPRGLRAIA